MHFTQFIMHKYIRAYSRLYASTREGGRGTLHILLKISEEKWTPQVNTNIPTGVHHDIRGYHLNECWVHEIWCRKKPILIFILSALHLDSGNFTGYKFTNTNQDFFSPKAWNGKLPLQGDLMLLTPSTLPSPPPHMLFRKAPQAHKQMTAELQTHPW